MIKLIEIIRQLTANAVAMRAVVETISEEQANWKPNPDTWSMKEVWQHLYNEERLDFRQHLKEMLHIPPQPWVSDPNAYITVESCQKALDGFLTERTASLAWLKMLEATDWEITTQVSFSPEHETFVLKAGDVLVSWVEHDILHMRQMVELLHAWSVKTAAPYSVQYAGGW